MNPEALGRASPRHLQFRSAARRVLHSPRYISNSLIERKFYESEEPPPSPASFHCRQRNFSTATRTDSTQQKSALSFKSLVGNRASFCVLREDRLQNGDF
jgi:hypothetical protein